MNVTSYDGLSREMEDRLKNSCFTYVVYDTEDISLHQLNDSNNSEQCNNFVIVLDEKYLDTPCNYPFIYYCNTIQELKDIILFVSANEEMFLDTVMYSDDFVSSINEY